MPVIFGLFVQLILGVLTQGPGALRQLIDIGQQTGALTPEQADQFKAQMKEAFAARRWQTDEQLAQGGGASAGDASAASGGATGSQG